MPEGHTIHRHARQQHRWLAGQLITASSPQGRFEAGAAHFDGRVLRGVEAWGKHLFYRFEGRDPRWIHVHLGLFGKFKSWTDQARTPRNSVRLRLATGERAIDLIGATTCAVLDAPRYLAVTQRLGPDPLREDGDPARWLASVARRRIGIGQLLMDQTAIAGVGNVYRAELLFLEGLHPLVPAKAVPNAVLRRLWDRAAELLDLGVRLGGRIVTVDAASAGMPVSKIPRGQRTWVYGQRACRACGTAIGILNIANRKAWFCPSCQPLPAGIVEGAKRLR